MSSLALAEKQGITKPIPMTSITWNGVNIPLKQEQTVAALAKSILKRNKNNSYTSVLLVGKSGSGKSTLTQSLLHKMSCINPDENYVIKWFERDDLHNLDDIIDGLEKGLKYCIIFDDVSYVMDKLSNQRRKELAEKLTHIRHDVQGNVITFMIIHYQKALAPILRDSDFRIITSMTDQDAANWKNTLGWNHRFKINTYQKQYISQFQSDYFYVNNADGVSFKYLVNKPFRIALMSDGVHLTNLLYHREGCNLCGAKATFNAKQKIDPIKFWDVLYNAYGSNVKSGLQWWAYYKMGKNNMISPTNVRIAKFIDKMFSKYSCNIDDLLEVAFEKRVKRFARPTRNNNKLEKELIDKSAI